MPRWEPPSEDEFNNRWLRPDDVLGPSAHRLEGYEERRELLEQLRAGLIVAVARNAQTTARLDGVDPFVRVPRSAWLAVDTDEQDFFWRKGILVRTVGGVTGYGDGKTERYFDIRFDPNSFTGRPPAVPVPHGDEAPPAPPLASPGNQAASKGGAPRKAFWDPLWIEMIRRIRAGTLDPKSSTELEGIMEDWLEEQGFTHGEGTLHRTAINLFKYLREG